MADPTLPAGAPPPDDPDDALAAEYVLGVLDARAQAIAAAKVNGDPAFRAKVEEWSARLAPMADALDPVTPPDSLRDAVMGRVFETATPIRRGRSRAGGRSFWSGPRIWQLATAAVLLLAIGAGFEGFRRYQDLRTANLDLQAEARDLRAELSAADTALAAAQQEVEEANATMQLLLNRESPVLIGTLRGTDAPVSYQALYWETTRTLTLHRDGPPPPAGRDFELWFIADNNPPVSLGVLPRAAEGTLSVPQATGSRIDESSVFAISIEPVGGSPTGAPTSPAIAVGKIIHRP